MVSFFIHPTVHHWYFIHIFLHAPCEEEELQRKIGPNQKSHFIFIDIILSGGQKFHSGYLGCPQSTTTVTQISQTNSFNPNTALHTRVAQCIDKEILIGKNYDIDIDKEKIEILIIY